ncbi:cytochrome c biogenesis protein CcsA [Bacteroides cellulosilyticus]|jgi:cytochrome c-type biogenesis protein CcsB|uniref:Cytochrome C biogenesis protein n=1 Tax=Bacteroides cellulosilyticus TaxID=246787 RepID=A0A412ICZ0_9BACE|nr:cytochrome c biogenesis protein CcsA [Bacteroides cellulosilyticus]RGS34738.1 cytochrome C biogenesis protein [Bacteroides cellulosilyticus]
MKKVSSSLKAMFTSWKITLILLVHYVILLAAATFVEKAQGTAMAREIIYNNPLFYLLQFLLILNFCATAWQARLWNQRKYGVLLLHISFIVILLGALVTNMFGFEGIVHIREGETVSQMRTTEDQRPLPFSIRLDDFKLVRYPGSHSPSSFESFLTIHTEEGERSEHIYMNKVIYEQGYRLYQSSYDADEQGTILTVNNDTAGTGITYAGYLLLLAGMLLTLADKKSRFRQLAKQLKRVTPLLLLAFLPTLSFAQKAETEHLLKNTIPAEQAEQWGRMQIQCPTGRIEPVDTYTDKLLRKIYRSDTFEGLSSEQVIIGFLMNPSYWGNIPFIRQTNKELPQAYSLPEGKYIRFFDVFSEDGSYLISDAVDKAYSRPAAERSRLEKDLLKLDEKINILYSLQQGKMFALFPLPGDTSGKWYSPGDDLSVYSGKDSLFVSKIMPWYLGEASDALRTGTWESAGEVLSMMNVYQQKQSAIPLLTEKQVSWELFYNKARLFFWSAMGYMAVGLLLLIFVVGQLLKPRRWVKTVIIPLVALVVLIFLLHTSGIGIRWYISGRAPWANAYESMIYVAWATALAGLLFIKRSFMTLALAAFFAGIILFVANLNFMDPEITPLVPVLKSYWLMIHVAVITASYGFFGISFLLGLLTLAFMSAGSPSKVALLQPHIHELRIINEMSLHIGLYLLTAGIFLGAVWANESWGRYWGWDPKETWALITMVVYAFILHARFLPALRSDYAFSVMSVLGLASVLMTYFGVNYYLSGLHSYGGGDTPPGLTAVFITYACAFALMIYAGYRRARFGK